MSYIKSQVGTGNQAVVSIAAPGGTPSTATYTVVGEIVEFTQSGTTNKTDDSTNLNSIAEEFVPTILTPGSFSGTMNRISNDAGQIMVNTAFGGIVGGSPTPPTLNYWKVQLAPNKNLATPQTVGDSIIFLALVEEFSDFGTVKADKKVATTLKLKISGAIYKTLGS
jgi:hypothetical protein